MIVFCGIVMFWSAAGPCLELARFFGNGDMRAHGGLCRLQASVYASLLSASVNSDMTGGAFFFEE